LYLRTDMIQVRQDKQETQKQTKHRRKRQMKISADDRFRNH